MSTVTKQQCYVQRNKTTQGVPKAGTKEMLYDLIPALALGQWFSRHDKNAGKSEAYKVKQPSEQSSGMAS